MSVLAEPSSSSRTPEPPFRPVAHIGCAETRRTLCGAPILGIHAHGDFELCERCKELRGSAVQDRMTLRD
jgi:hypothetical protein